MLPQALAQADLTASQRTLSPLEVFVRCYAHLTQLKLPVNHPLRAAVVAGTLTPVNACMQILNEATLVASGANEGSLVSHTIVNGVDESLAVLKTLNDYHHNIFPNDDMNHSVPEGVSYTETRYYADEGEAGLHLTRALLTPGVNFSQVATSAVSMEALRDQGAPASLMTPNNTVLNVPGVQIGNFLGVRRMSSASSAKQNAVLNDVGLSSVINASQGGGIIGTHSYYMLNSGRDSLETMDGGLKMPRRWAKAVFQDLLCRTVPVLRYTDATALVETPSTATTPPFRNSAACMQCHGAMDPMAATARNLELVSGSGNWSTFVATITSTLPAETGTVDSDPNYYLRPTNGMLRYRAFDGTLVQQNVTSIQDLGNKIAATDDLYVCAAAHYFRFFTGINVNLQDAGDTTLPPLSNADLDYRNQVITLGKNLKTSQSLQSLIQAILSSPIYQKVSIRDIGGQ